MHGALPPISQLPPHSWSFGRHRAGSRVGRCAGARVGRWQVGPGVCKPVKKTIISPTICAPNVNPAFRDLDGHKGVGNLIGQHRPNPCAWLEGADDMARANCRRRRVDFGPNACGPRPGDPITPERHLRTDPARPRLVVVSAPPSPTVASSTAVSSIVDSSMNRLPRSRCTVTGRAAAGARVTSARGPGLCGTATARQSRRCAIPVTSAPGHYGTTTEPSLRCCHHHPSPERPRGCPVRGCHLRGWRGCCGPSGSWQPGGRTH